MPTASKAREALLDRIVTHCVASGIPHGSMRAVARELGTSYQLLTYHFGDYEGMLRAVLGRIQAGLEVDLASYLDRRPTHADPWHLWLHLVEPGLGRLRVQTQCVGLALVDPDRYGVLGRDVGDAWRALAERLLDAQGIRGPRRRARATLLVAALRGLAIDLAATDDRRRVDAAVREFRTVFETWVSSEALSR